MPNYVNLLDIVYPVGSVYITFSDVSPVDSIGGSWEKIDGKFLQSSSETNHVNSTGGSSDIIGFCLQYNSYFSGLSSLFDTYEDNVISLRNSEYVNDYNKNYITYGRYSKQINRVSQVNSSITNSRKTVPSTTEQMTSARWDNRPAYITCNMYKRTA